MTTAKKLIRRKLKIIPTNLDGAILPVNVKSYINNILSNYSPVNTLEYE